MSVAEEIEDRLREALNPSKFTLANESHLHHGHSGWDGSGESHFHLVLASQKFKGLTKVQCHRLVYQALSPVLMQRIHALRMDLSEE